MVMSEVSLYTRLGGYDALAAAVDDADNSAYAALA
jgi:hypothetical protein